MIFKFCWRNIHKLLVVLLFLNPLSIHSQDLTIDETVEYINNILPKVTDVAYSILDASVIDRKIECDKFGNITFYASNLEQDGEVRKWQSYFSLKEVEIIWVYELNGTDGKFSGYQIRGEDKKLSVPDFTIVLNNEDAANRIANALIHLKNITIDDPFK